MFDSLFPKEWTTLQRLMWLKTNALARAVYEIVTGNPVTFSAKAAPLKQLQIAFSPVQDLHGYENPWPAGGGKNKFDPAPYASYLQSDGTYKLTGTQAIAIRTNIPESMVGIYCCFSVKFNLTNSGTLNWMRARANVNGSDINGSQIANGNTGTSFVEFTPVSTDDCIYVEYGSGGGNNIIMSEMQLEEDVSGTHYSPYAPYSNECPISGWDSLTVEQRGVNLFDKDTMTVDGFIDDATGAHNPSPQYKCTDFVPVAGGTTYRIVTEQTSAAWGAWYDANKNYLSPCAYYTQAPTQTSPANARYVRLTMKSNATGNVDTFGINYPSTDHDYHAYNPSSRSISITLGQTVYSGTVDVVTGQGGIDYVKDVYDGSSDEVWGYTLNENPAAFYTQISHPANNPQSMGNYLKRVTTFASVSGFSYIIHSGQIRVSDMGGECADTTQAGAIAKLRAYLAANPFEVVHKITTPITIQLTPQEVESLAGDNVLFSDANGDLTVEYRSN